MIRRLIERLARGRAFRRRLPADVGGADLLVSPDAQLKYMRPGAAGFDEDLLRVVREHVRPESRVWDIGANVGVFAFAAAGLAVRGDVVAVEADPWLAQLIRRSIRLPRNASLRVRVLSAAVSDRNGVADFHIAARGRASNSLAAAGGRSQAGGAREILTVPTITLDTLLESLPAPDLVKIDVEGAELMVLRGATRLLEEVRPTLYIEVGTDLAAEVAALLRQADYTLHDGAKPHAASTPSDSCHFNTLAIPVARTVGVLGRSTDAA